MQMTSTIQVASPAMRCINRDAEYCLMEVRICQDIQVNAFLSLVQLSVAMNIQKLHGVYLVHSSAEPLDFYFINKTSSLNQIGRFDQSIPVYIKCVYILMCKCKTDLQYFYVLMQILLFFFSRHFFFTTNILMFLKVEPKLYRTLTTACRPG